MRPSRFGGGVRSEHPDQKIIHTHFSTGEPKRLYLQDGLDLPRNGSNGEKRQWGSEGAMKRPWVYGSSQWVEESDGHYAAFL